MAVAPPKVDRSGDDFGGDATGYLEYWHVLFSVVQADDEPVRVVHQRSESAEVG